MRSTNPGRLSSSQDFSIGRSISLTRSSRVRALLLSTVLARVLKADSTADTVERDRICWGGAPGLSNGGSYAGCRCAALAAVSVNSRTSSGSILWNEASGESGTAISSVSSNTSPSGKGGLTSSGVVASSRPFSNASMSSWLFGAAGAGAGAAGGGAGLTGGAAAFATAACAAGLAGGGTSFMAGALAAGAATAGFATAGAGPAGFSAAAGLASSSAMMRRIDAKISSIEGSWTFAGCVSSDSTSSPPSHAFYTKHDRSCAFRICRPGFSPHQPDLSPDQAPLDTSRGIPPAAQGNQAPRLKDARCGANRSATSRKGMSWQQSIASNARAHDSPNHALGQKRGSALDDPEGVRGYGGHQPAGMRTPLPPAP